MMLPESCDTHCHDSVFACHFCSSLLHVQIMCQYIYHDPYEIHISFF